MTQDEIDFLLKISGHRIPNGYDESGMLVPIASNLLSLRDMLKNPSQYFGSDKFLYKNSQHNYCININNIIDYLIMVERSLYETIEFVENFKRKNKND